MDGLLCNLFGGPGVGKSTIALGTSLGLKLMQVSMEFVPEVAKDMHWEGRTRALLEWQGYVTGKQHRNIARVLSQVDVVVTDSPILTGCFYKPDHYSETFDQFWVERHREMNTLNYLITRDPDREYDSNGRYQTEEEANELDEYILEFMDRNHIDCKEITGGIESAALVVRDIMDRMGRKYDGSRVLKLADDLYKLRESLLALNNECTSTPS